MSPPEGVPDRSSGTYWLVVGGIAIAVYVVVLALLTARNAAVAVPVLVLDLVLYAVMVAARLLVRRTVPKQWTLAACLLLASALSLAAVIAISALPG